MKSNFIFENNVRELESEVFMNFFAESNTNSTPRNTCRFDFEMIQACYGCDDGCILGCMEVCADSCNITCKDGCYGGATSTGCHANCSSVVQITAGK